MLMQFSSSYSSVEEAYTTNIKLTPLHIWMWSIFDIISTQLSKMESMVNLEKEFLNLYVQKKKNGHIKSIIKYFNTAQEKVFASKHNRQDSFAAMDKLNSSMFDRSQYSVTHPSAKIDYFYNQWAMRTCI